MIVDTSAIIAILKEEHDADRFAASMASSESLEMSAASYLEAGIVADRNKDALLSGRVDQVIAAFGIAIVPVTETQARIAREAYQRFGKGSGHPASLNFGDCFSYALAADSGQALLFKGDDFKRTDLTAAYPSAE